MFISFDSLHELREFLTSTGLSKAPEAVAAVTEVPADEVKPEVAEKPKRTRRTKAEQTEPVVEQVVEQVTEAEPQAAGQPESTSQGYLETIYNYENANRVQAVLDAPDGRTATLAGIAAMQEAPEEAAEPDAPEEAAEPDAEAFINARADELIASEKVSKPVEHMARCTQFIGAFSRAVYYQSFELAGLPTTIATFKAPQIARHQAALEFLSRSK